VAGGQDFHDVEDFDPHGGLLEIEGGSTGQDYPPV
jgi:hypothetical protein